MDEGFNKTQDTGLEIGLFWMEQNNNKDHFPSITVKLQKTVSSFAATLRRPAATKRLEEERDRISEREGEGEH